MRTNACAEIGTISLQRLMKGERHDRRREVGGTDRLMKDTRRRARPTDHHRHVKCRLIQEQSMRQLSMFAERFAVITDNDDDRARPIDDRQQSPDLRIHIRNLPVIRLRIRLRRRVRSVRVVQMNPREERSLLVSPSHAMARSTVSPPRRSASNGVELPGSRAIASSYVSNPRFRPNR